MTDARPIGLMIDIAPGVDPFGPRFKPEDTLDLGGARYVSGRLDGIDVVIATGDVGKVAAATMATLLVVKFRCRALISVGIAQILDPAVRIGDTILAARLVQADYGLVIDNRLKPFQPGVLPVAGHEKTVGFRLPPATIARAEEALALAPPAAFPSEDGVASVLRSGTLLTADSRIVYCEQTRHRLQVEFSALAIDMSGAAVAQTCRDFGLPVIVVRVADNTDGSDTPRDWSVFSYHAGAVLARAVRNLLTVV